MNAQITTDQVWEIVAKKLFAVLGMVTARGEARTVGIVYIEHDRKLYVGTRQSSWKARHVRQNPHVSLTIPIAKRIPLLPWFKIPAATITCAGTAMVLDPAEVDPEVCERLFRSMAEDPAQLAQLCILELIPQGDFLTYGVGVSLLQMREPAQAQARVPVGVSPPAP